MCHCVKSEIFDKKSYLFIGLCTYLIMYDMYSRYRYCIYGFRFMCLFTHFIVYWGYCKFVYDFTFLMYLVTDYMHWIRYDFEHSASICIVMYVIYLILSFFLGFRRPNLITGLSGWRTPD